MLKDAILDFFQAIVVFIELLLHLFEVKVVLGIGVPRQIEHIIQIGILYRVIWSLGIDTFQFLEFLVKVLLHFFAPLHLAAALLQFLNIVSIGAQFLLNGADLLLQEVVTLLL